LIIHLILPTWQESDILWPLPVLKWVFRRIKEEHSIRCSNGQPRIGGQVAYDLGLKKREVFGKRPQVAGRESAILDVANVGLDVTTTH